MPSSRNFIVTGFDPTSIAPGDCVSLAELLQMLQAAAPASDIGFCIISNSTPDAGTYPELGRFLWLNKTNGEVRYYNGSSWQLIATIALMPDGSVTIAKLSISGGAVGQIIRVNASATAFEFANLLDCISNNSLPIAKLVKSGSDGILFTSAGAVTWKTLAQSWDELFLNAVPAGSNRDFLYIDGTSLAYGSINTALPNNIIKWNKLEYGTNILTITSGAITIDASLSGNHKVTLTGNITTVNVSNMIDGQTIQVLFKQDATGGRTVAFGTTIKFVGGSAPVITTTASHGDVISISQFDGQLIGAVAANATL